MAAVDSRGLCCLVCYNTFKSNEDQHVPRNLECGHTYCSGCLTKLADQNHGVSIRCPTCKAETPVIGRFRGIHSLPKNFGILEILDDKSNASLLNGGVESEKDRNKWLCPEHDEALKVFCFTDNCLICIYCQVYGSHVGHKCELASNIASDAREEHRRASKKLGDIYDTISKAKKRVSETREHLLETQGYLKFKIKKHHGVLKTCLTRRELTLKADVESMTKARLDPIEAQEGLMTEILEKADKAYSLIKKCEGNDGAMVEDKAAIDRLINEVSDLYEKCETEPKARDNLAYQFEYDTCCTLETKVGKILELDANEHDEQERGDPWLRGRSPPPELITNQRTRSARESSRRTGGQGGSRPNVTSRPSPVTTSREISPQPSSSSSETARVEQGDSTNSTSSQGAEGGVSVSSEATTDGPELHSDQLLEEIQKEIDRLKLLGPEGNAICLTEKRRPVKELLEVIDGDFRRVRVDFDTRFSETFKGPQLTHTARPGLAELRDVPRCNVPGQQSHPPEQAATPGDEPVPTENNQSQCCAEDCRHTAVVQCSYCGDSYCVNCSLPTCRVPCKQNNDGCHNFYNYVIGGLDPRLSEGPESGLLQSEPEEEWECELCTMINQPYVLACVACKKTRGVGAAQGSKVCSMCTLVNRPGAIVCELCDTSLVKSGADGCGDSGSGEPNTCD